MEVMGRLDKTFKPKLNEDFNTQPTETNLNVDEVLNSYLETALWAESDENNELYSKTVYQFDKASIQEAKNDIIQFLQIAKQQAPDELNTYDATGIGHNFWLSRNGHGAGFFDDNNDQLQEIAKKFNQADIYVGDDGRVYINASGNNSKAFNPSMNEKMIGTKPRGMRDDVAHDKGNGVFRGYTHFAVIKGTNKIVNGWDYRGYDSEDLKTGKNSWFFNDIRDMQINPKDVAVVTTKYLQKQGIDPFNWDNWNKDDSVFTL